MSHQIQLLEHLVKKLQDRIVDISEALQTGSAKDFPEYQNLCGVVRGLELAQMESNDLLHRLKDIENDN